MKNGNVMEELSIKFALRIIISTGWCYFTNRKPSAMRSIIQ